MSASDDITPVSVSDDIRLLLETLLSHIPPRYQLMVLVAIETGVRWGELAALRPLEVDLDAGEIHVRRVVLEVSKKITGADSVWTIRDYPKDKEHRTIRIGDQLCRDIPSYLMATGKRGEDLLFSTSCRWCVRPGRPPAPDTARGIVAAVSDLAETVLPPIRTRADLWRWSTANEHGGQMHEAVAMRQGLESTTNRASTNGPACAEVAADESAVGGGVGGEFAARSPTKSGLLTSRKRLAPVSAFGCAGIMGRPFAHIVYMPELLPCRAADSDERTQDGRSPRRPEARGSTGCS